MKCKSHEVQMYESICIAVSNVLSHNRKKIVSCITTLMTSRFKVDFTKVRCSCHINSWFIYSWYLAFWHVMLALKLLIVIF